MGNNSSRRMVYSPSHNIHNNSSLNYKNKKELLSKTLQHTNSTTNITNKLSSPISPQNKPINKININLNNGSSISYRNINYSNLTNRKSLYQYPHSRTNLSQTNFINNTNLLKNANNNFFISNHNGNDNITELKNTKDNKTYKEKNNQILSKNASMKYLNFNGSILNNLNSNRNEIQKLKYSNIRNNRIGSLNHYNFDKNNSLSKYIFSQRSRPISGSNSTYRKNSNSGLNLIQHYY